MSEHRETAAEGKPALVAIVGKSDSGKTTLIEKVVPELVKLGLRVGTVKHDAHSFEIDHPGKDSWRHGQAGAEAYVIASPERLAFITKLDGELAAHRDRRPLLRRLRHRRRRGLQAHRPAPRRALPRRRGARRAALRARRGDRPRHRRGPGARAPLRPRGRRRPRRVPRRPPRRPARVLTGAPQAPAVRGRASRRAPASTADRRRRTAERRIPLDIPSARIDDARDAVYLIRIAEYLGASRGGHRARLRVSDHGEVWVWRRT